ncbi:hypothetical protein AA101099_2493 [Neoasaia chiangmaiensis NBRC 101099]|uniref:Uncharacterized protein n=1 Tax=Neoasaia chiangmaiensis TaxID=320497 RepID=A0A1U9KPV9_9PROT|nr:lysylphosphatidylglycerol synthase domain-containing protein [Neoasaia chiangmaiensis]AQS87818.1 hypothetical protein A0U93_07575 [Neoasaia chiangmaiensis]GBR41455.1 hypothetical protein AA101099_2493 [Neoasaia chiangmaiensis NBRC 101099]GEN14431.1 hypothetical protein NCH01_08620 [Neoasaia chiangmaiensis]
MKKLTFLLSLLGIAVLTAITAWLGVGPVLGAMQRIGFGGFAALLVGQVVIDVGLGLAWLLPCPDLGLLRTVSARAVRDAAGNCLPFSQLGGIVLGIRATCAEPDTTHHRRAVQWPEAVAANLVDITTEVLGQIVFVLLALLCLVGHQGGGRFIWPVLGGMALLSLGIAGFIWTQHRGGAAVHRVVQFFGQHIAAGWRDSLVDNMDAFQAHLDDIWQRPGRVALGATMHLLCWLGSAALSWFAFRMLGADLSFAGAIAIEGVVCGIMSAGFLVPAALGVQEAAYVALGMIFGVDAKVALGLSLLRRGRDIALGIPVLLLWQMFEMRRLGHRNRQNYEGAPQGFDEPRSRRAS